MTAAELEADILAEIAVWTASHPASTANAVKAILRVLNPIIDDYINLIVPAALKANAVLEDALVAIAGTIETETVQISGKAIEALARVEFKAKTAIEDMTILAADEMAFIGQTAADVQLDIAETVKEKLIETFDVTQEQLQEATINLQLVSGAAIVEIGTTADTLRRAVGGLISQAASQQSALSFQLQGQVQNALAATAIASASASDAIASAVRRVFSSVGSDVNELRVSLVGESDQTQVILRSVEKSLEIIADKMETGTGGSFLSSAFGFLNEFFKDKV